MLHLFNRSEVFITYSLDNLEKVLKTFDKHGIEYTVKITKVENDYTDEIIKSNAEQTSYDLSVEYKVYIQKIEMENAHKLVHEALFPKE